MAGANGTAPLRMLPGLIPTLQCAQLPSKVAAANQVESPQKPARLYPPIGPVSPYSPKALDPRMSDDQPAFNVVRTLMPAREKAGKPGKRSAASTRKHGHEGEPAEAHRQTPATSPAGSGEDMHRTVGVGGATFVVTEEENGAAARQDSEALAQPVRLPRVTVSNRKNSANTAAARSVELTHAHKRHVHSASSPELPAARGAAPQNPLSVPVHPLLAKAAKRRERERHTRKQRRIRPRTALASIYAPRDKRLKRREDCVMECRGKARHLTYARERKREAEHRLRLVQRKHRRYAQDEERRLGACCWRGTERAGWVRA